MYSEIKVKIEKLGTKNSWQNRDDIIPLNIVKQTKKRPSSFDKYSGEKNKIKINSGAS